MPCEGLEPTIPASERAKTAHAPDRSATATGLLDLITIKILGPNYNLSFIARTETSGLNSIVQGMQNLIFLCCLV
jgi:hypothetical protein